MRQRAAWPASQAGAAPRTPTWRPKQGNAGHAEIVNRLCGPAFDRAFAGMMVDEHRRIIRAYEDAARSAPHESLRAIARHGLPVLRGHLATAQALLGSKGNARP
ncbi:DUF4142 domain-containing protein [Fulvimonas sp. R45]|uniref:DUF4142 domain-containing protein n=1 Tax=Fulvimonas sp. R45 TaxID=3045937 RepID=UPI00265DBD9C|nr:DUF4142 domain-containing protein [Fulvimonas sp. R45]MDO1528810.1 DUF4142 domain-containing protein [Fulvimonas sp. R45]